MYLTFSHISQSPKTTGHCFMGNSKLSMAAGEPAQNRVLWLVVTFIIEMNERPFDFWELFDLDLQ